MISKLDSTLLTFGAIGMFIKFLDTNNITNAFVSGGSPHSSACLAAINMGRACLMRRDEGGAQYERKRVQLRCYRLDSRLHYWPDPEHHSAQQVCIDLAKNMWIGRLMCRLRPHIWIPFQEVGWTVFTFALAGAKNWQTLAALRFIVGLCEYCTRRLAGC